MSALADALRRKPRAALVAWALPAATCAAYAAFRLWWWPVDPHPPPRTLQVLEPLATVGHYMFRVVLPWPQTMQYFHIAYGPGGPEYALAPVAVGLAVVGAYCAVLWHARQDSTAWCLLVACAVFMGPLLNIIPTGLEDPAQDRFLYAPLFFGACGLLTLFRDAARRVAGHRTARLLIGGAVVISATLIIVRTLDYRDERTFWEAELVVNPGHPRVLRRVARLAMDAGDEARALDLFNASMSPAALKLKRFTPPNVVVDVHFWQVGAQASVLADGDVRNLEALLAELRRLDGGPPPRQQRVGEIELGEPLDETEVRRFRAYYPRWYLTRLATLATRLGDQRAAASAFDHLPPKEAARTPAPLLWGLALARAGRAAEVNELLQLLSDPAGTGSRPLPQEALTAFRQQQARAAEFAALSQQGTAEERAVAAAMRSATLWAFIPALRQLRDLDAPDPALLVPLLVACRLDDAALAEARRGLPSAEAAAFVAGALQRLPEATRSLPGVPGADWRRIVLPDSTDGRAKSP
jgi:hypothetical protein